MSAVIRLRAQGFDIRLTQQQSIAIKPADKLPDEWCEWIRDNRQQVVNELKAEAANDDDQKQTIERWDQFLSLATDHGIHPDVVGAEFPNEQDRLDVVGPANYSDEGLRAFMDTLCKCTRVKQRQADYNQGRWVPAPEVES